MSIKASSYGLLEQPIVSGILLELMKVSDSPLLQPIFPSKKLSKSFDKISFMLLGLISDTHITAKRGKLPKKVMEEFKDADLIIHAGDITQQKVLDELEAVAPVIAVLGNNDKLDLNRTEVIEIENFRIGIGHGTDCSDDFDRLCELACRLKVNVLITGHTHRPHCEVIDDILFINPGSSNRPVKSDASIAVLDISEGHQTVRDIEIRFIEL